MTDVTIIICALLASITAIGAVSKWAEIRKHQFDKYEEVQRLNMETTRIQAEMMRDQLEVEMKKQRPF